LQESEWGPNELLDYVYASMDPEAEVSDKDAFIFQHFMRRWPDHAVAIVKCAFQVYGGKWRNQSVAPYMFTKGYDPYLATEILRVLDR
jgi:hypothetical protein